MTIAASLEAAIRGALEQLVADRAIDRTTTHWVAFSGGLDSSVLLHALTAIPKLRLRLIHVNHRQSALANTWVDHARNIGANLNVPVDIVTLDAVAVGANEDTLRRARYTALRQWVGDDPLWLAHHRDDAREHVFLRLLRGSGLSGLAPPQQIKCVAGVLRVRPFTDISRDTLRTYARDNGLEWVEDPANADRRFMRNRIRHEVLPHLTKTLDRFDDGFNATLRALTRDRATLDWLLEQRLMAFSRADDSPFGCGERLFELNVFDRTPHAVQGALLRQIIRRSDALVPSGARIDAYIEALHGNGEHAQLRFEGATDTLLLQRWRESLYCYVPRQFDANQGFEACGWCYAFEPSATGPLDLERTEHALAAFEIDFGIAATRVDHPTLADKTTTLKKLLTASAVPPWQREILPVVRHDDKVIYVPGVYVHPAWRAPAGAAGMRIKIQRK